MPAALPLQTYISQESSSTREYRNIVVSYGNGYEQRVADGLNAKRDKWTVIWENLTLTDFTTLLTALDAAAGTDYFTWTAPGDSVSKKFVQDGPFTKTVKSGGWYDVSVPLKQVFDL